MFGFKVMILYWQQFLVKMVGNKKTLHNDVHALKYVHNMHYYAVTSITVWQILCGTARVGDVTHKHINASQ